MKAIRLTSPLTRGARVTHAQKTLKTNRFQKDYLQGAVDGDFGEGTARGCKRAKFWCGYPASAIQPTYGDTLDALLTGKRKLPPAYATRRKQRVAAAAKKPLRLKALARAVTQLGVEESPAGTNQQKFGAWYGDDGEPWCAMFVTWAYVLEGSTAFKRGSRWAYVPWIVNAARAGQGGLAITTSPYPGDLACYDWDNDGIADHVGLFERPENKGAFSAIEGNTGIGNDSNGGKVMRRERQRSSVQCFVHVGK